MNPFSTPETIKKVKDLVEKILSYKIEEFLAVTMNLRGTENFKEIFFKIQELLSPLNLENLHKLPENNLVDIFPVLTRTNQFFNSFKTADHTELLQNICNELNKQIHGILGFVVANAPYLNSDYSGNNTVFSNYKKDWELQTAENNRLIEENKKINEQLKIELKDKAVQASSKHFQDLADDCQKRYVRWTRSAIGLAFFAIILAVIFMCYSSKSDLNINFISSKITVFVIFIYLIFFSAKNATANRHNYFIAMQKVNALNTFKALIESAELPGYKDKMLEHVANCIFSLYDTGLSKGESSFNFGIDPTKIIKS